MKERKNNEMKHKIFLTACDKFSEHGYEHTSVDSICQTAGTSKGIIYYYFHNKDDLYLYCVKECFDAITAYLKDNFNETPEGFDDFLQKYFQIRRQFLDLYPHFHNLFYNNLVSPPMNLLHKIEQLCAPFEQYNAFLLEQIFVHYPLNDLFTMEEALQYIKMYQNGVYVTFSRFPGEFQDRTYEEVCLKSLKVLMIGLLK